MINQYNNKRQLTINGRKPQVQNYTIKNEINVQRCSIEYIRKYIRGLKEIKRRSEVLNENDIRTHFM